ncbi:MAG: cytochrome ubiquinol oxidase subunit I [Hyphomicrobiales bacterium]|nr:cytochrome ubiquinol oxidase subunit I [Hyphomicrobiales bacterium]
MAGAQAILLARMQFAFTVGVHIVFPALSIGLSAFLAALEALWLARGDAVYLSLFNYWKKPFAVVFGMGVVSGVVMSYQFGANWSAFSERAGPVIGPLLGYEVLTAFFMEAGFLGIMLFGLERVGPRLHMLATALVALGTAVSAFWITVVNSWMQTPAGYSINGNGQFVPADWFAVVFNPSLPYRFSHMLLAAYLSTSFVVGAVGARHLLRDRGQPGARLMFSMAMWMAALVAPAQIVAGDMHGLNTLEWQPAKVAAMEGDFETIAGAPLILFGLPDMKAGATKYAVGIPHLGSLILTHSWNGAVKGLNDFPAADRPDASILFWSFRIMVALGFAMFGIGLWSLVDRWRGRLYDDPWLHRAALLLGPAGLVALLAGWTTTEVGRQPFTVYGLMRTAESASPIAAPAVGASLAAFVVVYLAAFGAGLFYAFRLVRKPPEILEPDMAPGGPQRAAGVTPIAGLAPVAHG